ncbi:MAG: hypothetical protein J1E34_06790 [Oscillospiraceae bacterium]|nr:hypothetical protein [Oscillospiraceae bacterium]
MRLNADKIFLTAEDRVSLSAAKIFQKELFFRTGKTISLDSAFSAGTEIRLVSGAYFGSDDIFEIKTETDKITFAANGIRGLIFAIGLFLRKSIYCGSEITLISDISGVHSPEKKIRGHQLGFRPASNTYDKWSEDDFERYMLENMFFGMNTVEFIPFAEQNSLMKYPAAEMTAILSEKAKAMGLQISLWVPNGDEAEEQELKTREELFKKVKFIDDLFIPGSDPGSLPAKEMLERCKKIKRILKKYHPNAEIWPSAQAPHNAPTWGDEFIEGIKSSEGEFAGVITGPNRAFNIDILREKLPENMPIRFYPDVTHNLRCEHPVHFDKDDWHYAFSTALSRESINPRPTEYKRLYNTVSPYTVGSVTYSDGVNDDVNKAVWCSLDWDSSQEAEDIVSDYARVFFHGYDTEKAAASILLLEKNWESTPLEKSIDKSLYIAESLKKGGDCWRFEQLYFRALCDKYIKERFMSDTVSVNIAKAQIENNDFPGAKQTLNSPLPEYINELYEKIEKSAKRLFEGIGMQLSVEKYFASGWERGATLDTISLPVTDKQWLSGIAYNRELIKKAVKRNDVKPGEFYYSFALHPFEALGAKQEPDFYMDFQGDRRGINNGTLPVCLQKLFDHITLKAELDGFFPNTKYFLTLTYKKPSEMFLEEHTAKVNGKRLEKPKLNTRFTQEMCPENFFAYTYVIPPEIITDGKIKLEITEKKEGFETAELRITLEEDFI